MLGAMRLKRQNATEMTAAAMATDRIQQRAIWRSYAMQAVACVGGALLATSAIRCALDGRHEQAIICAVGVALAFVVFDYASEERRARRLENVDHS